ncbi:MAG: N-acetylornithine carbamoyltransferase [Bacteroidetes bacterium]|nr:N-acetylornithine carbamoyltransferase [Bacteroidota bacterium]
MHLLDWHDVAESDWTSLIEQSLLNGADRRRLENTHLGKSVGLVFFNDSLRTRVSMELAAASLGATSVTVTPGSGTWGFAWEKGVPMLGAEAEHIQEAVGVLSRYVDLLGVRLFASGTDLVKDMQDNMLKQFAAASAVPVLNLESASRHPCQALADAAVLTRHFSGQPKGKKFVLSWAYHPKPLPMAVPHSTLLMAARLGMNVTVARPDGFELDPEVMKQARQSAAASGGSVEEMNRQDSAMEGAHIVYAKAWGGKARYEDPAIEVRDRQAHSDWRVTRHLMALTNGGGQGKFMHCLPVRRGVVVDDDVLDGAHTLHLEQAEYRLHAQKAILSWLWERNKKSSDSGGTVSASSNPAANHP